MKHILLLEDDRGVSAVLVRLVEEEKYYVTTAARVADAQAVRERVKVDLLIAVILLPDGTAFALVDTAAQRSVPHFLITGNVTHMAQLEANGDFHLSKAFKLADFLEAVRDRIGSADGTNEG